MRGSDGPLIEHNRADNLGGGAYPFITGNFAGMWPINSRNPVFQFNEVTRSYPSIFDSTAWDCDGAIVGTCTYQYNFSAGNAGGFFLGCQGCTSLGNFKAKEIIRYDVSQDDCRAKWASGSPGAVEMYNNTFFCASKPINFTLPSGANTAIRNNIFIAAHGSFPTGSTVTYDHNLYWGGVTPASGDANKGDRRPRARLPRRQRSGFQQRRGLPAPHRFARHRRGRGHRRFGQPRLLRRHGSQGRRLRQHRPRQRLRCRGAHVPEPAGRVQQHRHLQGRQPGHRGFSLSGRSYSADALAAAGFTAGPVTSHGVTLRWTLRVPDNVKAAGQKIALSGSGTAVAFLGSAGYGNQSGTETVT